MAAKVEGDCCSICLGEFKDPRILPCHHIFCLQCLSDYVAGKKQFNCPNCMTEIQVPEDGVAALKKYVEEPLLESTEAEVCNVCEKGSQATFQCFECNKCMCDACKKCHDVFSSKHQVCRIQTSESEKSFCKNHPEAELQFYCKTCKCLICQLCMEDNHGSEHLVLGIEDYFTEIKKQFEDYQKIVDAKLRRISEFTDSFISTETMTINELEKRIPKLKANLNFLIKTVCRRKKNNSEEDEILSNRLMAAIKYLDKHLNKSENIQELVDLTLDLEFKIQTHKQFFLNNAIDKNIEDEMGTLNVTIGRLFSFPFRNSSVENNVFFVGGIHWTVSATLQKSYKSEERTDKDGTTVILKSFSKEEDEELVESVKTDLVFTLIVNNDESVVKKQFKTFSCLPNKHSMYRCGNTNNNNLECALPYCDRNVFNSNLQILFDIKEIKYKNNSKDS